MSAPHSEPAETYIDTPAPRTMRPSRLLFTAPRGVPSSLELSQPILSDYYRTASTPRIRSYTSSTYVINDDEKILAIRDLLTFVGAQNPTELPLHRQSRSNYTVGDGSFSDSICSQDMIPRFTMNGLLALLETPDRPPGPNGKIFREYIPLSLSKFNPGSTVSYERNTTRSKSICSSPLGAVSQSADILIDQAFLTSENSFVLNHSIIESSNATEVLVEEKSRPLEESQGPHANISRPDANHGCEGLQKLDNYEKGACGSQNSPETQAKSPKATLIITIPIIYCPITKMAIGVRGKTFFTSRDLDLLSRKGRNRGSNSTVALKKRKRLKLGCWTCRVRHKSCPENKPECGQCLRLHLPCDYSSVRPQYMRDPESQAKKLEEIQSITVHAKRQAHS